MKAKIYYKSACPFCQKALQILANHNIETESFEVSNNPELREKISSSVGGYQTVPMIFIDDNFIGGCSELQSLESKGKLS